MAHISKHIRDMIIILLQQILQQKICSLLFNLYFKSLQNFIPMLLQISVNKCGNYLIKTMQAENQIYNYTILDSLKLHVYVKEMKYMYMLLHKLVQSLSLQTLARENHENPIHNKLASTLASPWLQHLSPTSVLDASSSPQSSIPSNTWVKDPQQTTIISGKPSLASILVYHKCPRCLLLS